MNILLTLMYVIQFLVAALLILVILVQRSKAGGGLGGLAATSSGVEEAFGSDAGNVLVKVTIYLAIVFGINTIGIGIVQGYVAKDKDTGVAPIAQTVTTEKDEADKSTGDATAPTLTEDADAVKAIPEGDADKEMPAPKPADSDAKATDEKPAVEGDAEAKPADTDKKEPANE